MDLDDRKARMRRAMAARRRALPEAGARRAAAAVATRIATLDELARFRRLVLYVAADGELPTEPLVALARQRGLAMLWPRLEAADLAFARAEPEDLRVGAHGIPAPAPECAAEALAADDLLIVPGLAFDGAGRRLGRGGGHYDRVLEGARERGEGPRSVGVGYDFQWVEEVPVGAGDQPVDVVVTEQRIVRVPPRRERG